MASVDSSSMSLDKQSAEVNNLKTKYQDNCKIIKDMGDFTYMIEIKHLEYELAVKFQLEADYPSIQPAMLIKTKQLSEEEKQELTKLLEEKAQALLGSDMMQLLFEFAVEWAIERVTTITNSGCQPTSPPKQGKPSKKSGKKKGNQKLYTEEGRPSKKLASMKTATDVVSRILWDEQLDMENFTVGYIDRFVGIVERSFSTFTWEDLASVDYDALAIPKHRIQYFKYKGLTVWDKDSRMDNVFGSTGSGFTITDIIEKYENGELTADSVEPVEAKSTGCDSAQNQELSDVTDSDDEDDVIIKTGIEDDDTAVFPRDKYWGVKKRPTHFLCLRVTDPEIREAVKNAQTTILDIEPSYEENLMPTERLHITLLCLGLDTKDEVNQASNILHKIKPQLETHKPKSSIEICLNGVDNFFRKVLYAKVEPNQDFLNFVHQLSLCVQENGLEIRDVFDFNPHMTLFKFKKPLQKEMHTRYIEPRICEALAGTVFGTQVVDNVHLCEMSEDRDECGFYICPTLLKFDT